ncbi:DUF2989 domain-containing protein [Rheinheimera riviphila]|uniref:DUF2989 domain-containing protein n=1 Tax=Rheinheimera riviphila TaxID=1834037 RepID=A0A437QSM0_9GAMM|nr:DUF2989 domain-containing protein [Rheinheimera riviphila]RVU37495.1 DUF2989 domain-containing protein [Rheinheimera riviphila]
MKRVWLSLSLLLLAGCEPEPLSVVQICKENPAVCNDLNEDSHCNVQRAEVIFARFAEGKLPSDPNKHKLLISFEKYSKCIELASGIQHIKLKEKTTSRVNGFLTSLKEIKRLTDETVSSEDPNLLQYHWSRHQSKPHLDKFLQAEKNQQLETPELQLALASYYMKRDVKKTIAILHHALSLYPAEANIDPEIYTALTTIHYKQRNFQLSYLWALIAEDAGIERIEFARIKTELAELNIDADAIEPVAETTLESIKQGRFQAPVL